MRYSDPDRERGRTALQRGLAKSVDKCLGRGGSGVAWISCLAGRNAQCTLNYHGSGCGYAVLKNPIRSDKRRDCSSSDIAAAELSSTKAAFCWVVSSIFATATVTD